MTVNVVALALRMLQRSWFVYRLYGLQHALLAIPRMVIGNFINAMAAARAWRMYITHLVTGKKLVWDKTMHDFPSTDQLVQQRQRLGELLLSWQAIEADKLGQALEIQRKEGRPLGEILTEFGWIDAEALQEAIAYQQSVDAAEAAAQSSPVAS